MLVRISRRPIDPACMACPDRRPTYPVARAADRHRTLTDERPPAVLVVVPARGGSKGIPRKNLRSLHGRPLIAYAIETALRSSYRPLVVLTSDDDEILSVGEALGATPHHRPSELAGDDVTLDGVVYEAYRAAVERSGTAFDVVVTMQPTSPLLTTGTLDRAVAQLLEHPDLGRAVRDRRHAPTVDATRPHVRARLHRAPEPAAAAADVPRDGRHLRLARLGPDAGGSHRQPDRPDPRRRGRAIDVDGAPRDSGALHGISAAQTSLFVPDRQQIVGLGHAQAPLAVADAWRRRRIQFLVDHQQRLGPGHDRRPRLLRPRAAPRASRDDVRRACASPP